MSINPSTENVPGEGSPAKQQEDQKLPKAQDNRNELSAWQKIMAGILLIAFTLSAILLVIGYWPNKAPIQNGSSTYSNSLFHINLIDAPNKIGVTLSRDKLHKACDSCLVTNKDTIVFKIKAAKVDTLLKFVATDGNKNGQSYDILQQGMYDTPNGTIQYDVLLLILVALCGFLGNMIHMATSFTAFVGANKFAKSWLLW